MPSPDYPAEAQRSFEEEVKKIAARLRTIGDDFEREALATRNRVLEGDERRMLRTERVALAWQNVNWGIANAHIDAAVRDGLEADLAEKEAENG